MIRPLAVLLALALVSPPVFAQDPFEDDPDVEKSGFVLTEQEIEGHLAYRPDRTGPPRRYFNERCDAGGKTGIERDIQQVCFRYVLCKTVEAIYPRKLHDEWCGRRGAHSIPKDTGHMLAEMSAEAQAWKEAETSILDAIPRVRGESDELEGRREVLQFCLEQGLRGYTRSRHCLAEKLDAWRAPREARLQKKWVSDHYASGQRAPDVLLPGMTGENLRSWEKRTMSLMRKDAEGRAKVPLASASAYDAFIRAQDAAAARNTAAQVEKERLAANQRAAASDTRLWKASDAFKQWAPDAGAGGAASPSTDEKRPASTRVQDVKVVGGESASGFRPRITLGKSEAPPPP